MMRKIKIIVFLIIGYTLINAQSSSSVQSDIANIIPPAPQTFNFSVQNTNFINTPSGEFTYNLPLYIIDIKDFSLPISLNYRSGVKVDDLGSNVGISWQLSAGGVVSRIVRDMPDELAPKRWLPENVNTNTDVPKIREAATPGEYVDTEYDWFNFNVSNGFSGNFYLDQKLEPIYSGDDYKVSKIQQIMSDGKKYFEFIITDKFGNKYFFGGQKKYVEETTIMTTNNSGNTVSNPKPKSATGWFLYKITSSSGREILLDYETDSYDFFSSVESSLNVDQKCACNGSNGLQYNTSIVDSKTLSSVTGVRLISVSTDKEILYFSYDKTRNDVTGSSTGLLTSIVLKNKSNRTIKNYSLNYDEYVKPVSSYYFTSSNLNTKYRYFLNQVAELNSNEKHKFEYYQPEDLPSRFSLSTDYYGYFNNKGNDKPFPKINDFNSVEILQILQLIKNKIPDSYISADKEVEPTTVYFGNLKKITYPTGGNSVIFYEPNKTIATLSVENHSKIDFEVSRQCGQPTIIEQKKTITSNGSDLYIDAEAYVDYSNCGEPDDIHETYGMSIKDLYSGTIIWSKNKKVSDGSYSTDLSKCTSINPEYCPVKTIAGRNYEITLKVSSKIGEISGIMNVQYNKVTTLQDKNVFYAGSRVQRIVENNNEGKSYSKNYFYNYYNEKNSQKTKISFYIKPQFFYIKSGLKNCYIDCGCYNLPSGTECSLCMSDVDAGSGGLLNSNSVGYTTNSLFNSFNNRSNKPFYSVITEEIEGKSILERVYNEYDDTPSLTFTGSEIYNLPYSNTSNLTQGKIKEENIYEYKNSSYNRIGKHQYDYDFSKNYMLKSYVFKQNYPIPPYFLINDGYIDNISIAEYYNHYGEAKITKLNKEEIVNANSLYSITTNQYESLNHYQPTSQIISFPDSTSQATTYQYAHEKSNQYLIDKNMIGIPLQTTVTKNNIGISSVETKYPISQTEANTKTSGLPLPTSVISYGLQIPGSSSSSKTELTYDLYDDKSNIVQYTEKGLKPTVIIWGYNQTQPIAKIEGISYNSLMALSGVSTLVNNAITASNADVDAATEQSLITALINLRSNSNLSGYNITTYTYDPLIGVTSITPPTGIREIYKYDTANRLQSVVDMNGKILKEYQYNYKQ